MKILTREDREIILRQSASPLSIRLRCEVIDINTKLTVGMFYGVVAGSASINATSDVRRTCNFTLQPSYCENIELKEGSMLWLDKELKLTVQIYNPKEAHWIDYPFGTYVFTDTSSTYDATTNQMTVNCSDYVTKLNGTKNGQIGMLTTSFPAYSEYTFKGTVGNWSKLPYPDDNNVSDNIPPDKNDIWWCKKSYTVKKKIKQVIDGKKKTITEKTVYPEGYWVYVADDYGNPAWQHLRDLMNKRLGYMKYTRENCNEDYDKVGQYMTDSDGNKMSYYDDALKNSYYANPYIITPKDRKTTEYILEDYYVKLRDGKTNETYDYTNDNGPVMVYVTRASMVSKLSLGSEHEDEEFEIGMYGYTRSTDVYRFIQPTVDGTATTVKYWMKFYRYNIIREIITDVLIQMAGIDNYYVTDIGEFKGMKEHNEDWAEYRQEHKLWNTLPSDQEFSSGDTIWGILTKFRDLYPGYEMFFDPVENNAFKCQMVPMCYHDEVVLDDIFLKRVVISESSTTNMAEVRNVVEIWGECFETDFYACNDSGSECPIVYTKNEKTERNVYKAKINSYGEVYYEGDVISFKAPATNEGNDYLCIWGDQPKFTNKEIPIYNVETNTFLEPGTLLKDHTYTFRIKREYDNNMTELGGVFKTTAYLQGSYRVHAISVLTDGTVSNEVYKLYYEDEPYDDYEYGMFPILEDDDVIGYEVKNAYNDNELLMTISGAASTTVTFTSTTGDHVTKTMDVVKTENTFASTFLTPSNQFTDIGGPSGGHVFRYMFTLDDYLEYYEAESIDDIIGLPLLEYVRDYYDRPVPIYEGERNYDDLTEEEQEEAEKLHYKKTKKIIYKYSKEYFKDKYNVENVDFYCCPDSPYTVQKLGELFYVESDEENLQNDRYAMDTAHWRIYQKARLTDNLTITTILLPWLDVNVKVSYKPHIVVETDEERQYVITSVSHDFTNFTSTIQMYRFYPYYDYESVLLASEIEDGTWEAAGTYTNIQLSQYTHEQISHIPANLGGDV